MYLWVQFRGILWLILSQLAYQDLKFCQSFLYWSPFFASSFSAVIPCVRDQMSILLRQSRFLFNNSEQEMYEMNLFVVTSISICQADRNTFRPESFDLLILHDRNGADPKFFFLIQARKVLDILCKIAFEAIRSKFL